MLLNIIPSCRLGNKVYVTRLLRIKNVRDEDMHHNFTCIFQTGEKPQIKIVKLKKGMVQSMIHTSLLMCNY